MHGHKTCTAFCSGVLLVVQEFETSCLLSVLLKTKQAVTGPVIFVWNFKLPNSVVSIRFQYIFLNVISSMTAGTQLLLMWDIIFFFFLSGWVMRGARLSQLDQNIFSHMLDWMQQRPWQNLLGCDYICLLAEDQPDVPHKTFMEVAVVSSIKCYALHYLYKALWKCENCYLNRVVQLRVRAATRYANWQSLGTTRYFMWCRYFSLLPFTSISSCGEDAICCVSRRLWHVAILFDICGSVSCLMLCFMAKLLLCTECCV